MGQAIKKSRRSKSVIINPITADTPVEPKIEHERQDSVSEVAGSFDANAGDGYSDSFVRNALLTSVISTVTPTKAQSPVFDVNVSNVLLQYISQVVSTPRGTPVSQESVQPKSGPTHNEESSLLNADVSFSYAAEAPETEPEVKPASYEVVLWLDPEQLIKRAARTARELNENVIALPDRDLLAVECM
jgi:hypothetical protein